MLILSREALVRVALHAWHVYGQEAFGYLLGSTVSPSILAALPCSRTHDWRTHADRWNGIDWRLPAAEATAAEFGLVVVGLYCSETDWDRRPGWWRRPPTRPDLPNALTSTLLVYTPVCCRGHSNHRLFRGDTLLVCREDYAIPRGRRADPLFNGRRIHQAWRRRVGQMDYDHHDKS